MSMDGDFIGEIHKKTISLVWTGKKDGRIPKKALKWTPPLKDEKEVDSDGRGERD